MSLFCKWHREKKDEPKKKEDKNDLMWIWCVYSVIDKHIAGEDITSFLFL